MLHACNIYLDCPRGVLKGGQKREFSACQTHRSMYPFVFNRFPVIQHESLKVRHFSTFLHILAVVARNPLHTCLKRRRLIQHVGDVRYTFSAAVTIATAAAK